MIPKAFGLPGHESFKKLGSDSEATIFECSFMVTQVGNDAQGIYHVGDGACEVFED